MFYKFSGYAKLKTWYTKPCFGGQVQGLRLWGVYKIFNSVFMGVGAKYNS